MAAGPGMGSRGQGASLGAAGDGDGQGLDDRVADAPPSRFREGGSLLPPLVDCRVPIDRQRWLRRWRLEVEE